MSVRPLCSLLADLVAVLSFQLDSASYVTYAPNVTSVAWTMWRFYDLNHVTAYASFYDASLLAFVMHLWATIRGLSLLVTNSPFIECYVNVWYLAAGRGWV
jgi:hypothetical protein